MIPDSWMLVLNFYLIVASAGELTMTDFSEERLAEAYQECPRETIQEMLPLAEKLVLEFQAKQENTEVKNSPIGDEGPDGPNLAQRGQNEEYPNGPVSIPMLGMSTDF